MVSDAERLRTDLAHLAPMLLPVDARALSLELAGSQITVRVYLHGPGSLSRWADLDAAITPLVLKRAPGAGSSDVVVQAIRQDRPAPLEVFGDVLWAEDGTTIASRDGRRAES